MRADHPKLWHPIRITIVVITVWWILFCLVLAPTDNPAAIVWTIIEIAVLLLSPFFPKSMSLLFLIMSQSGPWLIPGADVNSLPGILYTFGMLAYETNNLVALLLLAYSIGDQLFRQLVLGTSNSNPVAIIAMVSLVLMLGCGLRWNATMTASRAEAEQAKIFQRFYRSPAVSGEEGVGIGLYLARQIAAGQGGYLKVTSRPGEGSTFSLFLPRVE